MTYKETFLFLIKCLSINQDRSIKAEVKKSLELQHINWDTIVKVSTAHYIFPALYCNFKRSGFLSYLPSDLITYMEHITQLNRDRNSAILKQARELNSELKKQGVNPIFLKGSGHLLNGLYFDIGERMIGDIDFLIADSDISVTEKTVSAMGYHYEEPHLLDHRHFPRITHPKKIAAIEIHKRMLRGKYSKHFSYEDVKNNCINTKDNALVLSIEDQLKLTVFSKLINDFDYYLHSINLRGLYDFSLLTQLLKSPTTLTNQGLHRELNAGVQLYSSLIPHSSNLKLTTDQRRKQHLDRCLQTLDLHWKKKLRRWSIRRLITVRSRIRVLIKALFKKDYRAFVLYKISNKSWIRKKWTNYFT